MQRKPRFDEPYDDLSAEKIEDEDNMEESGRKDVKSRKIPHLTPIEHSLKTDSFSFKAVRRAKISNQRPTRFDLRIFYDGSSFFSKTKMVSVYKSLRDFPWLQSLSLDFHYYRYNVTNEAFSSLCKSLTLLTQLQNIDIEFGNGSRITDEELNDLSASLRSLSRLESVNIKLDKCPNVLDQGFRQLGMSLRYLQLLKSIMIISPLQYSARKNSEGIVSFCDSLKNNIRLQNLELCFYVGNLNNVLTSLISSFKRLSVLQNLSLKFHNCAITTDGLARSLSESLKYLISLRKLTLEVRDDTDTNQEFIAFCQGLKHYPTLLRSITLKWASYRINNIALKYLGEALLSQTSLQHIILTVTNCPEITEEGVSYLTEALGNMVFLQSVSLDFYSCIHILDDGIRSLSINLACLTLLQSISLGFDRIADEGVRFLSVCLRRLTGLQNIHLAFSNPKNITDKAIELLTSAFRQLSSLKYVSLSFSGCQITDQGISSLGEELMCLIKLKSLHLNTYNCKVTLEGENNLQAKFKGLKDLKITHIYL